MKHDVPALPYLTKAEDPCAFLGDPWGEQCPDKPRRRGLAAVWPFRLPHGQGAPVVPVVTALSHRLEAK